MLRAMRTMSDGYDMRSHKSPLTSQALWDNREARKRCRLPCSQSFLALATGTAHFMSVKSSSHCSEKMRTCAPSEKGAFCLPPKGVCAGGAGRTQSARNISAGAACERKGTESWKKGDNYLKKVLAKGGGEDMGRVCVAEHQKVVEFNNGFLIFSI